MTDSKWLDYVKIFLSFAILNKAGILGGAMLQKRNELLKNVVKKDGFFGLLNLGLRFVDGKTRPSGVNFFPTSIQVELTTACNLHCTMCEHSHLTQKPVSMSFEAFKGFLDNAPFVELINFTGIGEILLNPDWYKIMEYAKGKGLYVWFNDNFTLMNSENAKKVIDLGVDAVAVSFDGATKKTYEKIRRGASFESVTRNIKSFVELRDNSLGRKKPEIFIVFVAMKENIREMAGMIELAKELGIGKVLFVGVITFEGTEGKGLRGVKQKELDEIFEQTKAKALELGVSVLGMPELPGKIFQDCPYPWVSSYITSSGEVLPCCFIKQRKTEISGASMGNIKEKTFREIWKEKKYAAFRKCFKEKQFPFFCRACYKMNGSQAAE